MVKVLAITVLMLISNIAFADAYRACYYLQKEWREQSCMIGCLPSITEDIESKAKIWREKNFPHISKINPNLMKLRKLHSKEEEKRFERQRSLICDAEYYGELSYQAYTRSLAMEMDSPEYVAAVTNVIAAYRAVATSKDWKPLSNRNPRSAETAMQSIQQQIDKLEVAVLCMIKMVSKKKDTLHAAYIKKNPRVYEAFVAQKEKERMNDAIMNAEMRARRAEARAAAAEEEARAAHAAANSAAADAMSARRDANEAQGRLNRAGVW